MQQKRGAQHIAGLLLIMSAHQRPGFWYPVGSAPYDNSVPNTPIGTLSLFKLALLKQCYHA